MARRKSKGKRGLHPKSQANLIPGFHGTKKYQNGSISTKLPEARVEAFQEAKGTLSNAEGLRQAVAFALEHGWHYEKPEEKE